MWSLVPPILPIPASQFWIQIQIGHSEVRRCTTVHTVVFQLRLAVANGRLQSPRWRVPLACCGEEERRQRRVQRRPGGRRRYGPDGLVCQPCRSLSKGTGSLDLWRFEHLEQRPHGPLGYEEYLVIFPSFLMSTLRLEPRTDHSRYRHRDYRLEVIVKDMDHSPLLCMMNAYTSLVRGLERHAGLPTAMFCTDYATAGVTAIIIE